jgi:hypothetical protein
MSVPGRPGGTGWASRQLARDAVLQVAEAVGRGALLTRYLDVEIIVELGSQIT